MNLNGTRREIAATITHMAEVAGEPITSSKANRLACRALRGDFDPDLDRMLRLDPMFRLDPTGEEAVHNLTNGPHATANI